MYAGNYENSSYLQYQVVSDVHQTIVKDFVNNHLYAFSVMEIAAPPSHYPQISESQRQ